MVIHLAQNSDKNGIYTLWQKVFGDTKDTIDLFFSLCYKNENAIVCEDDGKIVSMLFLIDADIVLHKEKNKAYYVYAVATDEEYRRKGIAAELLAFLESKAEERKISYLFLHPADEHLYNYYEKNGFKTVFYKSRQRLTDILLDSIDVTSYNYVKWSENAKALNHAFGNSNENYFEYLPLGDDVEKTGMLKPVGVTLNCTNEIIYLGFTLE